MDQLSDTFSQAKHLSCSKCQKEYKINELQSFAVCCNKPLQVKYSFETGLSKEVLQNRPNNMWRYQEMLPVFYSKNKVSLGEGGTPILPLNNLMKTYGFDSLTLKDEGLNPTGSFKARGISMAVSKAKELGVQTCIIPTAGNAGGAASAYCAAAGMKAIVVMPSYTPKMFRNECAYFGAELRLIDGLIDQCGAEVARLKQDLGAFDLSSLKEPYRLEGKKTMGYEIAEKLNWELPDVIIYPTGGGTGLIGIWKAFKEMIEMGWIKNKLPKMVAVQTSNCSPVVDQYLGKKVDSATYKGSVANGIAVPKAFGMDLMQELIKDSEGFALTVSEEEIVSGTKEIMSKEGICVAPEGGAIWSAIKNLGLKSPNLKQQKILLLNTGSGYKYFENY